MPRILDAGTVVLAREEVEGTRCLRAYEPCRGSGNCSPEEVGVILLFLDRYAAKLYPKGQSATRICRRSTTSRRHYDLVRIPIANDVSWDTAESRIREILRQAFEHIALEAARVEVSAKHATRSSRERRVRVFAPVLANGSVGVTVRT